MLAWNRCRWPVAARALTPVLVTHTGDGRFRIPKGVSNRMFQHSSSTGGAGGTGYSYSSSGMSWSANGRDGRDGTSGGGGGSGGGFNGGDGGSRGSGGEGQTVLVSPSGRSRATLDRAAGVLSPGAEVLRLNLILNQVLQITCLLSCAHITLRSAM